MARICVAIPVTILALCASTGVQAADPVPDKVGVFVSFCATHFADCKNKVVSTDVATMAAVLFAKKGTPSAKTGAPTCVIPKGVNNDTGTKKILAWLGEHNNTYAMTTEDGIHAAQKALWNCQTKIGDGTEPGGPPAKIGQFVVYCSSHYAECGNEMVAVTVSIMAAGHSKHCLPPDNVETKEMTVAALGWLGQHQETYALNTDDGITAAFDHLWPCH